MVLRGRQVENCPHGSGSHGSSGVVVIVVVATVVVVVAAGVVVVVVSPCWSPNLHQQTCVAALQRRPQPRPEQPRQKLQ